jgi:hypothetical protein
VIGTIRYGAGRTGYLLYIKASIIGREGTDIRAYRARNPKFPHEPTSQQFFKEGQFEAYRALGYFIAGHVFSAGGEPAPQSLPAWFEFLLAKSSGPAVAALDAGHPREGAA